MSAKANGSYTRDGENRRQCLFAIADFLAKQPFTN